MKYKNKKAFTLAEALMALLITTLIIAAALPVLTKKHRVVAEHGRWECTTNASGTHYQRTVIGGVDSGFSVVGSRCTFSPPAKAENFIVKAVGGGGGGAGGTKGANRTIMDNQSQAYVEVSGVYNVTLIGGGGAGGGMACGDARDFLGEDLVESQINEHTSIGSDEDHKGWYNVPDESMRRYDYNKILFTNKEEDRRKHLPGTYCFAERDWGTFDLDKMDKCWYYPGQGGAAGQTLQKRINLTRGETITARIGEGGTKDTQATADNPYGLSGSNASSAVASVAIYGESIPGEGGVGENTTLRSALNSNLSAAGGGGGYNRYIDYVTFKDVPVWSVPAYKRTRTVDKEMHPYCNGKKYKSSCSSPCTFIADNPDDESANPWGTCKSDVKGVEETYDFFDWEHPVERTESRLFRIPVCVNRAGMGSGNFGAGADEPQYTTKGDEDQEGPGSGGWGAGQATLSNPDGSMNEDGLDFLGDNGVRGNVIVQFISYVGGGGGKAGAMVYSAYKKLPYLKEVKVGTGGKYALPYYNGNSGRNTTIKAVVDDRESFLVVAAGGQGGRSGEILPNEGKNTASGGDGAPSPLGAGLATEKLVPYGGSSHTNTSLNGMSVQTPVMSVSDPSRLVKIIWALDNSFNKVNGTLNSYTYGAGGGGGGGSTTKQGIGGAGGPGIVIIEW